MQRWIALSLVLASGAMHAVAQLHWGVGGTAGIFLYDAEAFNNRLREVYQRWVRQAPTYSAPAAHAGFVLYVTTGALRLSIEESRSWQSLSYSSQALRYRDEFTQTVYSMEGGYGFGERGGQLAVVPALAAGLGTIVFRHQEGPPSTTWPSIGFATTSELMGIAAVVRPSVALDVIPASFVLLRLQLGYVLVIPFEWTDSGVTTATAVPAALSGSGVVARVVICIGSF